MSMEPTASAPSEDASVAAGPAGDVDYSCEVSVKNEEVSLRFIRDGMEWNDPPGIPAGATVHIDFTIQTKGFCFETFDPHRRNNAVGPFLLDFDRIAPPSQRDAGIRCPPVLDVEIAKDRLSARMTFVNRYSHRRMHRYSLLVRVVPCDGGKALTSPDPTLIEDPYDGGDCEEDKPRES
jgi:hypothetical protein